MYVLVEEKSELLAQTGSECTCSGSGCFREAERGVGVALCPWTHKESQITVNFDCKIEPH